VIVVLVAALLVGPLSAFGERRVDDVAATRTYLLARHRLAIAGRRERSAGVAAVRALSAAVKSQCPGVLAQAPEGRALEDVKNEILNDVLLTSERPARKATFAFAKTVQRLRWTNRKLTYYATHAAREEAAKERVPLPDLCADAKSFAASGFQSAPRTTEQFIASCDAANSITVVEFRSGGETGGLEERIWHLLKPYERSDERTLIPRKPTKRQLERELSAFESDVAGPILEIGQTLGLADSLALGRLG
jgi:hypothetical protein